MKLKLILAVLVFLLLSCAEKEPPSLRSQLQASLADGGGPSVTVGKWDTDLKGLSKDEINSAVFRDFDGHHSYKRFFGKKAADWYQEWDRFSDALTARASRDGLDSDYLGRIIQSLKRSEDAEEAILPVAAFVSRRDSGSAWLLICVRADLLMFEVEGDEEETSLPPVPFGHVNYYVFGYPDGRLIAATGCD